MTPDLRRHQHVAAATLASLLTQNLPLLMWHIDPPSDAGTDRAHLVGQASSAVSYAKAAEAVRRWAAALGLPAPAWTPYAAGPGGRYAGEGTYGGVPIKVWTFLPQAPSGGENG